MNDIDVISHFREFQLLDVPGNLDVMCISHNREHEQKKDGSFE